MTPVWLPLAVLSVAIAVATIGGWIAAAASGLPLAYGEGGVIHAGQLLARGEDPYAVDHPGFVSANYPPLAYITVALGLPFGPFAGLRVVNILAAVGVAAAIAWRARGRRPVAIALAGSFIALFPVASWTPQARVDLIAVALVALGVASLDGPGRRGLAFGALAGLALLAKPTALLPVGAVLAYLLWRDRPAAGRAAAALLAVTAAGGGLMLARSGPAGLYQHLVVHNALGYDIRNPILLAALALLLVGAFAGLAWRHADGIGRAYLAGAAGVVLLAGHEGATFNYLLDLAAASCLALARAPLPSSAIAPALLTGQLLATLALTAFGPLAPPTLGQQAARVGVVAGLPPDALYYAEDSGLLIAAGLAPAVDDSYVWARLIALGVRTDDVTPRVEARAFRAIVSDGPLDQLESAPEFRQQRWPRPLADAVLRHYQLDASAPGAYRYVPRP